jgi:poly(3-hydroxybutyrate) depolymerase
VNDIQFTLDIVRYVTSGYNVDTRRIYAAGKSNGGGLVNLLACNANSSAIIAAFSPVSGAFYLQSDGSPPPCKPARLPIPIMEFHGWEDRTICYEGGDRRNSATQNVFAWVEAWAGRDRCSTDGPAVKTLCGEKKPVKRYSWKCQGVDDAVVHYNISNLKHDWPSINGNEDSSRTTCFDATTLIMEFFGKHSLP